jgi:hypothetical protein
MLHHADLIRTFFDHAFSGIKGTISVNEKFTKRINKTQNPNQYLDLVNRFL